MSAAGFPLGAGKSQAGEGRRPVGWPILSVPVSSSGRWGPGPPQHECACLLSLPVDLGLFLIKNKSPVRVFILDFDIGMSYKT